MFIAMLTLSSGRNCYDPVKYVQRRYTPLLLCSVIMLKPVDANNLWYLSAEPTWQLMQLRAVSALVYL